MEMNQLDLGYRKELDDFIKENNLSDFTIGLVTQEHRERYVVSTGENEYEAEITGNLRFSAISRADFPAVGDWVAISVFDTNQAIIHRVLPRKSILQRLAVGKQSEKQIISANIDVAFIVQSIDNNFNINRLERYLSICYSAKIEPVLIISKIDLSTQEEIQKSIFELEKREKKVKYFLLSNNTHQGLEQIENNMEKGKTYCILGSSGVGKSTLINNLLKKNVLETKEISISTNKGKHTTSRRELFVLENGAIVIDTPGMRELGMADNEEGIKSTFEEIYELSLKCKFSDCKHIDEKGCAIIEAVDIGELDKASYENYLKIIREQQHFQASIAEKRKKDKEFGKMAKSILKEKKKNKY
jgi:ribosome biogenesis GTPase / thiamine phosphate phosphatase